MTARFVDPKNCSALLPTIGNLPFIDRLENCLCGINDSNNRFLGYFHRLTQKNSKSVNSASLDRLESFFSPLDIIQVANVSDRLINTQAREMPFPGPSKLHVGLKLNNDLSWKVIVPIQYLLQGWGDANRGYQGYVHSIVHNMPRNVTPEQLIARTLKDQDVYYYVGITGRNWLQRLDEHVGEIHRGSRKNFHKAWRNCLGMKNVGIISSLMAINMTYDEAMNWEEMYVDKFASDQFGLNMIPGGFKGLKLLHKLGITSSEHLSFSERDRAIEEYIRRNPRKGIPNPFMSALWRDDNYYLKVIGSREKTLTPDQVRNIRTLHQLGDSVEEITKKVSAVNEKQVKDVLAKRTYTRIH